MKDLSLNQERTWSQSAFTTALPTKGVVLLPLQCISGGVSSSGRVFVLLYSTPAYCIFECSEKAWYIFDQYMLTFVVRTPNISLASWD